MKYQIELITNGNATSASVYPAYPGRYLARVRCATWAGASIKLQIVAPHSDAAWMDLAGTTLTADGMYYVELPGEVDIRAVVTGGPPTGAYVFLDHLEVVRN